MIHFKAILSLSIHKFHVCWISQKGRCCKRLLPGFDHLNLHKVHKAQIVLLRHVSDLICTNPLSLSLLRYEALQQSCRDRLELSKGRTHCEVSKDQSNTLSITVASIKGCRLKSKPSLQVCTFWLKYKRSMLWCIHVLCTFPPPPPITCKWK